jgi:hypothetical protein
MSIYTRKDITANAASWLRQLFKSPKVAAVAIISVGDTVADVNVLVSGCWVNRRVAIGGGQ